MPAGSQSIYRKTGKTLKEIEKETGYEFVPIQTLDGEIVYIPQGICADLILRNKQVRYLYSDHIAQVICQKIVQGQTIREICKEKGIPSYELICKWRRERPEFKAMFEQATNDRAELLRDKALEISKDANQNTVQTDKLQVDTLKWAAEKDNPDKYGKKTKISADQGTAEFILDTGIIRDDS